MPPGKASCFAVMSLPFPGGAWLAIALAVLRLGAADLASPQSTRDATRRAYELQKNDTLAAEDPKQYGQG